MNLWGFLLPLWSREGRSCSDHDMFPTNGVAVATTVTNPQSAPFTGLAPGARRPGYIKPFGEFEAARWEAHPSSTATHGVP